MYSIADRMLTPDEHLQTLRIQLQETTEMLNSSPSYHLIEEETRLLIQIAETETPHRVGDGMDSYYAVKLRILCAQIEKYGDLPSLVTTKRIYEGLISTKGA